MKNFAAVLFTLCIFFSFTASAQDTLPNITVIEKSGKIRISWVNPYKNVQQINIQRSQDSAKNYFTIHAVPNPDLKKYSYEDKTAKPNQRYYRLFILFEGAYYNFTPFKIPFIDSTKEEEPVIVIETKPEKTGKDEKKEEVKEPPPKKKVWVPSVYIYTANDGNVEIRLPDASKKNYSIKFYEDEKDFLFEIPKVSTTELKLDKVNFLHSGWFQFELYEDGVLKERNKVLITRDN